MLFEWDEEKAATNLERHKVPFDYAAGVFFDPHRLDRIDNRKNYDEERRITLGKIENRLFVVVYTMRADKTRIISARKANPREVKNYEEI
jgi:uncharacterized DUF497 family protein